MIDNSMVLKLFFLCLTLSITLVFGLYPKDFGREHSPFENSDGDLTFTKYSVATTDIKLPDARNSKPLTLDVNLLVPQMPEPDNRFSVIFTITDIHGTAVMLLGQWQNYLVLMSGDDYPNRNNQARITVDLDTVKEYTYPQPVQVRIETAPDTTTLFINEQHKSQSTDFLVALERDAWSDSQTVSLGNTLDRKHGWPGTLRTFTLGVKACETTDTTVTTDTKNTEQHEPCTTIAGADLRDQADSISTAWTLQKPYSVLKAEWLSSASLKHWNTASFYRDVGINLLGFVPITLAVFIVVASRWALPTAAVLTIALTALVSLLIESGQIILPSRTSSIIDLGVNSLAGLVTTLIACLVTLKRRQ